MTIMEHYVGFCIVLKKGFREWEWYGDVNTTMLYLHLLLTANAEIKKWRGAELGIGKIVSNPRKLAIETGLSEGIVRSSLKKLCRTGYVTTKRYKGETVYHLPYFNSYGRWMD
jgi:hypothetical protein